MEGVNVLNHPTLYVGDQNIHSTDGEAVSKNSVTASIRLARVASMEAPSLVISRSGHNATKPSSSRSMIAVNRRADFMVRV
jgi:hypothetical protein